MQADNIQKLTAAANVNVESYWPGLFAKLFANKSMDDLITNVGAGKHMTDSRSLLHLLVASSCHWLNPPLTLLFFWFLCVAFISSQ